MSGVFAAIIIARIIWWVVRSQSNPGPTVQATEAAPENENLPVRPQLGGYGITSPESDT